MTGCWRTRRTAGPVRHARVENVVPLHTLGGLHYYNEIMNSDAAAVTDVFQIIIVGSGVIIIQ